MADDVRIGLELHQQLDTDTKLFCQCPTRIRDEEEACGRLHRTLNPTTSELGEVDKAAKAEASRGTDVTYLRYDSTCLVEEDDEPPHRLNGNALDISLQVAAALDMDLVDQIHVMRKIIIDGSMPSGFQRTALVARNGNVETPVGKIPVKDLLLEEESGKRVDNEDSRTFSLDRLGIPLIEVGTEPVIESPHEARKVAEHLGMVFRSTGNVKRGMGTVRQDVNVSVPDGARVEIKGVQEIDQIETVIENEINRQKKLIEIADTLGRDTVKIGDVQDVTGNVEHLEEPIVQGIVGTDSAVIAAPFRGLDGVFGMEIMDGLTFGGELASFAQKHGVNGLLHTDELQEESPLYSALINSLDLNDDDAACVIAAEEDVAKDAMNAVIERVEQAQSGVMEETRRANPDGTTTHLRPLGGEARMYPETDIPPIKPDGPREAPKLLTERAIRYETEHGLSHELAEKVAYHEDMLLYEEIVTEDDVEPTLVARTITQTMTELERDGVPVSELSETRFRDVLRHARDGNIAEDSIGTLLEEAALTDDSLETIIEREELEPLSDEELEQIIRDVVSQNQKLVTERGTDAVGPLMGECMHAVGERADGEEVRSILMTVVEELREE